MTDPGGLSRRHFLGLLAGAAAAAGLAACSDDSDSGALASLGLGSGSPPPPPAADLSGDPFTLGVASGDPAADSVVLWTRLLPGGSVPSGDVDVQWEISEDDTFASTVAFGRATATAGDSYSVHAIPAGLRAATAYKYRFRAGDFTSPVGTTKTLPADGAAVDQLRFAFLSCQNYQEGFYGAYPHLVEDQPELVVFLGDFIYEEKADPTAVRQHRGGDLRTLDDYRARYAQYQQDENLQAARAMAPWIVIWDDHEVANDYADDTSASGSGTEFLDRRAAAYKVWWENQPVRMAAPTGPDYDINRTFDFGSLMSVVCLDGRQFRSAQVCETDPTASFASLVHPCADLQQSDREMLGTAQVAWVKDQLTSSRTTWNVIANQTLMSDLTVPNSPLGSFVQVDQWDGYPAARTRFVDMVKESGASNPVLITGDLHASVVGTVFDEGNQPVLTEFLGPSITSKFPLTFQGLDLHAFFETLPTTKPNLAFTEGTHHGYVVVTVTPDKLSADYRVVDAVNVPTANVSTLASFDVAAGTVGPKRTA